MGRRNFTAEFKHEAIKLVLERGMTISQASKDLGLHVNVLRKQSSIAVEVHGWRDELPEEPVDPLTKCGAQTDIVSDPSGLQLMRHIFTAATFIPKCG